MVAAMMIALATTRSMAYKNGALATRPALVLSVPTDFTQDPVATIIVDTPAGRLLVMAEPERAAGRSMTLHGLHVQGETVGPNDIGPANVAIVVRAFMEVMCLDELLVAGGIRTTGANPGRTPPRIRFTRRAASGMGW
jgi:hypothetical protein